MKYFSDVTGKVYESVEDLNKAELAVKKAEDEKAKANERRAERAKEVEDALKVAHEAEAKANKLMNAFIKDYGSFHYSFKEDNVTNPSTFFDWLFDVL